MNNQALDTPAGSVQAKVAQELRAHRRCKPGVPYTLSVIDGSGGMLELVEEPTRAKAHWFFEWTRALQFSNYGM